MKYHIITYGCQLNRSDSERIAAVLEKEKYKPAPTINEANLIIVNACSVRQSAVDRIFGLIPQFQKLKTKNPKLKTALTGCILKKDKIKFRDKFNFILDIINLNNWPALIFSNRKTEKSTKFSSLRRKNRGCRKEIRPKRRSSFIAYVPIIVGCSNFCSYCAVPYTRGPEVSRPAKSILKEIKNLAKENYKEIWLLGENVNSYNKENRKKPTYKLLDFPELLRETNKIPGNFWIRFVSSHPKDFSEKLIAVMAKHGKITPYLNLPIQSGDDEILKKMGRPYTAQQYKNLISQTRKKIPEIFLSTDIIVGFPGETKKQFEHTAALLKEIKFDMAYIAEYSPRPGTKAEKLKDDIPRPEKEKRRKILNEILKKTALSNNKKFVGQILEALPEYAKSDFLFGKTKNYKTVKFKGPDTLIGKFVKIKITNALPWGLKGKLQN